MANVRDSDTSLWLHNKLGTSNDSWISGSICSQLNKEVLRNIKECFSDLQTQVKLKLLLSFFHIPRRLVEEWKTELEEVIEVAGLDSELWVSMLAETMKTFPATSSLNTEISDYEETRPIFTEMVNDLRKLVSKHSDLGMLPLECQYLNKNALVSVVGQQPNPVKHFTLKRKPKSANLRAELLHKSADAQSSLKKNSAPTIPLRSRGMPRKMTDTTPLKGIPSRVPTSGFRSANIVSANQQRPNLSRTTAGRKDGGIKIIEFTDQPLGYAAAKKRKREQQLEEQQKKAEQKANAAAAAGSASGGGGTNTSPTASPTQSAGGGGGAGAAAGTPTTPSTPTNVGFEIKTESGLIGDDMEFESPKAAITVAPKTEPATPDYAPTLTYSVTPNSTLSNSSSNATITISDTVTPPRTKGKSKSAVATAKMHTVSVQTQSSVVHNNNNNNNSNSNNNNNNNNSLSFAQKRIKQEIEIKSEEIIVPANIKLEKIEPQQQQQQPTLVTSQTILQPAQRQPPRLQQRVIVQQQPQQHVNQQQQQQQHVLIRAAPQQQKTHVAGAGLGGTITLTNNNVVRTITNTTNNNSTTPIKMEKLEIKPLVRSTAMGNTVSSNTGTILTQQQLRQAANPLANLPNNISVKITSTKAKSAQNQAHQQQQQQQQQPILINSSTPVILSSAAPTPTLRQQKQLSTNVPQTIKSMPLSQLKSAANNGPVIISQTIIQPAKRNAAGVINQQQQHLQQQQQQQQQSTQQIIQQQTVQQAQTMGQQQQQTTTQYILTSSAQPQSVPGLTTFSQARTQTSTVYQHQGAGGGGGQTPTKILLKTSPTSGVMVTPMRQQQQQLGTVVNNPPPLIATSATGGSQQPTLLNLQNVQLPNRQVTIQPASQAAQQQHLQAQLQQQHPQQTQQQHTIVSNTSATQQPKLTQVLTMQSQPVAGSAGVGGVSVGGGNVKNKTIILTQKGVILRNIGGDMYQQIPISNMSGLQGLGTTLVTTNAGPPGLVKTTMSGGIGQQQQQTQTIQLQSTGNKAQALPTLIPTNALGQTTMIVQQQPQTQTNIIGTPSQQTIIRPVMTSLQGGLTTLPQGLTLIQRPGQQPQLVQMQTTSMAPQQQQQTQLQRTIITQPQHQLRQQQIVLQHKPTAVGQQQHRIITTTGPTANVVGSGQQIQIQQNNPNAITRTIVHQVPQQSQQTQQAAPQRKGLSLSNEHVHKAHEMFRKANRVSRPDKALILGFMAGMRENPRPNSENVIVIKLGDAEEKLPQDDGSTALCFVESHISLDYNTGEWKTFRSMKRLDGESGGQSDEGGGTVMQAQVI